MSETTIDRSNMDDTDRQSLFLFDTLLIVLIAIGTVRVWVAANTYVAGPDVYQYISVARFAENGEWELFFTQHAMPLLPGLTALLNQVIGDIGLSGRVVSIVMSLFGGLGVCWFAWRLFDDVHLVLLTGLLFAFHPLQARLGSQIYTVGVYTGTLGITLGLLAEAIVSNRVRWWILGGLFAGSTYLARMDGIGMIFVLAVWAGYLYVNPPINSDQRPPGSSLLLLFVFLLLPIGTLIGYKSYVHGAPVVSEKLGVFHDEGMDHFPHHFADQPEGSEVSDVDISTRSTSEKLQDVLKEYQEKLVAGASYFFLLFFIGGTFVLGGYVSNRHLSWLLGIFVASYLGALLLGTWVLERLSDRHMVPIISMALPVAAAGVMSFGRQLNQWFPLSLHNDSIFRGTGLLFLFVLLGSSAHKALTPEGVEKLALREVGETIRADADESTPRVLATEGRIHFYAQAQGIDPRWPSEPDQYQEFLNGVDWDYLVLDTRSFPDNISQKRSFLQKRSSITHLRTLSRYHHTTGDEPRMLYIYKRNVGEASKRNR